MSPIVQNVVTVGAVALAIALAVTLIVLLWTRRDSLIPTLIVQRSEALERERVAIRDKGEAVAERDAIRKTAKAEKRRADAAEGVLHALRARCVSGLSGDDLARELVGVLSEAGSAAASGAGGDPVSAPPKLLDPWADPTGGSGAVDQGHDAGRVAPGDG